MPNFNPLYTLTPRLPSARIVTANVNRDGTGTLGDVMIAGASGSRIDRIVITATALTTAGMVRLYIWDGVNNRLWREVDVIAVPTPSATVKAFTATLLSPDPQAALLVLPTGFTLRASTHNAESFDVIAHGGDF